MMHLFNFLMDIKEWRKKGKTNALVKITFENIRILFLSVSHLSSSWFWEKSFTFSVSYFSRFSFVWESPSIHNVFFNQLISPQMFHSQKIIIHLNIFNENLHSYNLIVQNLISYQMLHYCTWWKKACPFVTGFAFFF